MPRLFRLLLNYLMFASTMFFAAGSSAIADAGAGGGDGSADTSGDAGGSDSGDSSAGGDGQSADISADADVGDGSAAGDADPDAPVDLGDGRQVPAKWKNLFEAAKAQGLDKEVRQLFFGNQRLAAKFPGGINEAVQLADKVEELGGVEGLGELKQDNEEFHADADSFVNTPDRWIADTFAANPDACLTAFAHSLDYVSDHHPEFYDHTMAKVIINDLGALPVHDIHALLAGIKDNPAAQQLAKKLADYYNHREALSRKLPEKKVDAERAAIDADRQKLGTEQEQLRNHTINSQTIPLLGRQMSTHIEKIAKDAGFDLKKFIAEQPEAAKSLRSRILNAVMEKAGSDKVFVKNYKAVMKSGDTQRAIKMMNDKHNAILPEIVRGVARGFGIVKKAGAGKAGSAGGTARAAAAGGSAKGMTRVSAKPAANLIDWSRTGNDIYDSIATLKDGRKVTWA
jgi:hypothetical protein